MSATSTPNDSPMSTPILPLHNPAQAAHVVVPQAPLGNATNGLASQAPGMGAKALLAKKLAKSHNPTYISPTDNLMTPCTQKLSAAKKKHFSKGAKPISLFGQSTALPTSTEDDGCIDEPSSQELSSSQELDVKMDDPENPF